ncbi:MAG: hypothetical protein JXK05_01195 [Campylobacterales bacterium]|nr:hypothetical protein [Campylobacterales bacterium]
MKIVHSALELGAGYRQERSVHEERSMRVWDNRGTQQAPQASVRSEEAALREPPPLDPKLMAIVRALEALTGRKIRLEDFEQTTRRHSFESRSNSPEAPELQGWGIDLNYSKIEQRMQELEVSASGTIALEDGRHIDLAVGFSLRHEQRSEEHLSFKAGDALIDPLAIAFEGGMVTLSDQKIAFDLDSDGVQDEVSFVAEGSGFLALDRNANGTIDDGGELFGPRLNDGFAELADYDEDHNGWIDEGDAVFDQLLIWTRDASGEETLYTLKEKGIGAIYLQNTETPFEFRSGEGVLDGRLRATSIALRESGEALSVSELDLRA